MCNGEEAISKIDRWSPFCDYSSIAKRFVQYEVRGIKDKVTHSGTLPESGVSGGYERMKPVGLEVLLSVT